MIVTNAVVSLPAKVKNLQGKSFYELEVLDFVSLGKSGAIWRCKCACGNVVQVPAPDLKSGNTRSCGCRKRRLLRERAIKHGHLAGKAYAEHPKAYIAWKGMIQRCCNKNCKAFPNYGGRGIEVCPEWRSSYAAFISDMGEPPEGATIERIDVNKGYEKSNCTWISLAAQARNRRNNVRVILDGEEMLQVDAARKLNISASTLCRWRSGQSKVPQDVNLVFITL